MKKVLVTTGCLSGVICLLCGCYDRYVRPLTKAYHQVTQDCCVKVDTCAYRTSFDAFERGQTVAHVDIVVWNGAAKKAVCQAWGETVCADEEPYNLLLLWGPQDYDHELTRKDDDGRKCANWKVSFVTDGTCVALETIKRLDDLRPYQRWIFGDHFSQFRDMYRIHLAEEQIEAAKKASCIAIRFASGETRFDVCIDTHMFH